MKPRQFDNNNDIKKEQTKHTKNWKWYFNIYFVKGLVKRPLPIEAYINARTHFRKTGGSFSMMKVRQMLKRGYKFAYIWLF